jgi:DNA-binding NtrC family response regulator
LAAGEVRLPANEWILIVDDEFDIISIFKQALMKKGFHVFGFTDPLLALEHFQINVIRYGLVISDLRMPGMNGYELVKKVNEIKPEIKIFLMTAFEINDAEFKRLLPKVKIEGLLQKPISLAHLVLSANTYLQKLMSGLALVNK